MVRKWAFWLDIIIVYHWTTESFWITKFHLTDGYLICLLIDIAFITQFYMLKNLCILSQGNSKRKNLEKKRICMSTSWEQGCNFPWFWNFLKIIPQALKSVFVLYFLRVFHMTAGSTKNGRQKSWSRMIGYILGFFCQT